MQLNTFGNIFIKSQLCLCACTINKHTKFSPYTMKQVLLKKPFYFIILYFKTPYDFFILQISYASNKTIQMFKIHICFS